MVAALEGIQLRFRHDFRSSMPTLWAQLDHHFSRRTPRTFLVKIIKGMTQTDPSKRWTASQVFSALEPYGYCCETCSPHGGGGEVEVDDDDDDEDDEDEEDEDSAPSPWIYDPRYGKHYRVAHDAQGKPTSCSCTFRSGLTAAQATSNISGILIRVRSAFIKPYDGYLNASQIM